MKLFLHFSTVVRTVSKDTRNETGAMVGAPIPSPGPDMEMIDSVRVTALYILSRLMV
jgi:hypothetical protein